MKLLLKKMLAKDALLLNIYNYNKILFGFQLKFFETHLNPLERRLRFQKNNKQENFWSFQKGDLIWTPGGPAMDQLILS